jgi:hypothetical protein
MAGIRDRHDRRILAAFDRAGGVDLEEFGMQHSSIELEDQLGNLGTSRQHEITLHDRGHGARPP